MKRVSIFIIFILITLSMSAQSGGTGIISDPYWGDISTSVTWPTGSFPGNTVYIGTSANPDLRVISSGSLTINPGINVVFTQLLSDLIITGTGQITAGGAGSQVTFTKGSNSYWGHISFESMGSAPSSVFNNCIIEYGDVSSFGISDPHAGGGGMFIDFNDVSITNCIFRNNKAQWGGAIFVYASRNPAINNCTFYNNSAIEAGGGIYLWNYASSTINNSIFYSNSCQGTTSGIYTGGGLAAQSSCSITLANCTFANNSSSRTDGQGLMLYASSGSKVINSIFWGSANQVYLASGTSDNTIVNCAIQAGVPPGSVSSISLNSSNVAPDGPNFSATDGTDWSIKFVSPCRDGGTATSAPATDFLGNGRIGNYDIGAYEVQYSKWTGAVSTIWSTPGNWIANVDPSTGSGDVIVPTGLTTYPTGSSPDFTIGSGKQMTIEPGAHVTLGNLINNGSLSLQSDASNLSSLIISSYSGNDAVIGLFLSGGLAGGSKTEKWHYVSSPVLSLPVSTFAPTYTLNVVGWYDNRVTTSLVQGWVAYDGYVYSTGAMGGPTFSNLTPGNGYDYYDSADDQYTFAGQLNTGDVPVSLSYSVADGLHGFNLLGNPFSSGLNWDVIANGGSYPANTNKGISYTRNNTECTYIAGVGNPGDVTGIIPPMQGFFVRTSSTGNTITLASSARTHTGIHATYKKDLAIIPLVRLAFAEGTASDETVVRFDKNASTNLDNDFDGVKMFISTTNTQIYSSLGGVNYAINGQPFPSDSIEIPVVVNLTTAGDHNLSATQLQGLENYNLFLLDKTAGTATNLKSNPVVSFNAPSGKIADRFSLKIVKPMATGGSGGDPIPPVVPPVIDTPPIGSNPGSGSDSVPFLTALNDRIILKGTFNIYPSFGFINIQTLSDDWDGKTGSVRVLDLMGRAVLDLQNAEFRRGDVIQVEAPVTRGIYLVEIKTGVKRFVGKVMIR
jgi:hypothetical protein